MAYLCWQTFLGWVQDTAFTLCCTRIDVNHAWLSSRVGLSVACIPLRNICCVEHVIGQEVQLSWVTMTSKLRSQMWIQQLVHSPGHSVKGLYFFVREVECSTCLSFMLQPGWQWSKLWTVSTPISLIVDCCTPWLLMWVQVNTFTMVSAGFACMARPHIFCCYHHHHHHK